MADVTISGLNSTTSPARTGVIPYSDGSTTTKLTLTQVADLVVPIGSIMMWSGSIASIPANWTLCNGANGTPDLRNRFAMGAGASYNPGYTAGSKDAIVVNHTHTVSDPGHSHTAQMYYNDSGSSGSRNFFRASYGTSAQGTPSTNSATTGISIATTGSSGVDANLPPFYTLAYIMRIS